MSRVPEGAAPSSLDSDYFKRVYAEAPDPWHFATSVYELEKYGATLDALGAERFASVLEIGCSVGVLTAMLAPVCDELLAIDINESALATARERCATLTNVRFARATFPHDAPSGPFDLILLSEVAYYWSDDDLALAIERIATSARGGTLELVHFLPKVEDYLRDGDSVHEAFLRDGRFVPQRHVRAEKYRIDVVRVV